MLTLQPLAERILAREQLPHQRLADDGHGGDRSRSASVKSRPARCGMPIVRKKPGVTGRTCGDGACPAAGIGPIEPIEPGADAEAGHRQKAHRRRSARRAIVAMRDDGVGVEAGDRAVSWYSARPGNGTRAVSTPLGAEARVDVLQPHEAANQQAGAGEQHERQRHLGDDQRAKRAARTRAAAVTAALAQGIVGRGRGEQRRHQPEQQTGRRATATERERRPPADRARPDRAAAPGCDRRRAPAARDGRRRPAPDRRRRRPATAAGSRSASGAAAGRAPAPSAVRSPSSR